VASPLPEPSTAPFHIDAAVSARARALCIHGYTGTTFEVMPLAMALAHVGVSSTGMVLPAAV